MKFEDFQLSDLPYDNQQAPSSSPSMEKSSLIASGSADTLSKDATATIDSDQEKETWLVRLMHANIAYRWSIFVLPVLVLVWVPGVLGLTLYKDVRVWAIPMLWWSIFLSIIWLGWWIYLAAAMLLPEVIKYTLAVFIPHSAYYLALLRRIPRGLAAVAWSLTNWMTWMCLVSTKSNNAHYDAMFHKFTQGLFAIFLGSCIMLGEKVLIALIRQNFYAVTYKQNIATQKKNFHMLVKLYSKSTRIPLDLDGSKQSPRAVRQAISHVRRATETGVSAISFLAGEISGGKIYQANSVAAVVLRSLATEKATRHMAKRIYYSYAKGDQSKMVAADIRSLFDTEAEAEEAFALLDKDDNGDLELGEITEAFLSIRTDRLALQDSLLDLNSAVGRLDSILASIAILAAILVFVSMLDVQFSTLITASGTFILGLSWLIGSTAQEVLSSIIFVFIKHPYDIGDRVDIDALNLKVMHMDLLFTTFETTDGKNVHMSHNQLATKPIINIHRSGPMDESFKWSVDMDTTDDQIKALEANMLAFLTKEKRHFLPTFNVGIKDFPDSEKLILKASIPYRSNWASGGVKAMRYAKFINALRANMKDLNIRGPGGAADKPVDVQATQPIAAVATKVDTKAK